MDSGLELENQEPIRSKEKKVGGGEGTRVLELSGCWRE